LWLGTFDRSFIPPQTFLRACKGNNLINFADSVLPGGHCLRAFFHSCLSLKGAGLLSICSPAGNLMQKTGKFTNFQHDFAEKALTNERKEDIMKR
jgi:hypothetical protein